MMTPGIHFDLPEADYFADPALSQSGAKAILKSPSQFQWQRNNPVHKDVFDEGSAAHKLVLGVGPEIYVVPADNWMTKAAKVERDLARAEGYVPVLPDTHERVTAMADKLSEHTLAMRLLSGGNPEVSLFATDPETGVALRGRVDYLRPDVASDYKTSAADPAGFGRTAYNFGYHMQAAWYADLLALCSQGVDAFAFIVQSKEPPYDVFVTELTSRAVDLGRDRNREAIRRFRDCTESGLWPAAVRNDTFVVTDLPAWAYRDDNQLEEVTP